MSMTSFLAKRVQRLASLSADASMSAAIDSNDAQDAVSCLYHILQLHGSYLAAQCNLGPAVIVQCGEAMRSALQVRDSSSSC